MTTLAERLGYRPDDRLLIINCDDLGVCHAANVAVYEALLLNLPPCLRPKPVKLYISAGKLQAGGAAGGGFLGGGGLCLVRLPALLALVARCLLAGVNAGV